MEKIDFKKAFKHLYSPPAGRFQIVEVPELTYFMVDGAGDPNSADAYREAIEALYSALYTLKFMCKKELERDYVVPPLEALWWADDMDDFITRRKDRWLWTAMIMVPEFARDLAERAIALAQAKKSLPGLARIRVGQMQEGRSVQTLHIGSYDDEGPTLRRLHEEFLPENGLRETGHHHEIYLGDPRKTPPDRLRTILRQPVE